MARQGRGKGTARERRLEGGCEGGFLERGESGGSRGCVKSVCLLVCIIVGKRLKKF